MSSTESGGGDSSKSPLWLGLALVFVGLTAKDFFLTPTADGTAEEAAVTASMSSPTIKILYCYS